jgi:hypothetical protein
MRSCKGALFMAKEFTFQQGFGYGAAIDRHKRSIVFETFPVDGAGHQFFSCATLADNEHGDLRRGHFSNRSKHLLHLRAIADHVFKALSRDSLL